MQTSRILWLALIVVLYVGSVFAGEPAGEKARLENLRKEALENKSKADLWMAESERNPGLAAELDGISLPPSQSSVDLINQGFEGSFPPAGWTTAITAGDSGWRATTTTPHTGTQAAFNRYQPPGTLGSKWLITESVVLTGSTTYTLNFWVRRGFTTAYPPDTLYVLISTVDNLPGSFTTQLYKCYTGTIADTATDVNIYTTNYRKFTTSFTGVSGTAWLAFNHQDDDGQSLYLDDVVLSEVLGTDAGATTLVSPAAGGCYGTNQTVTIRIQNLGGSTIDYAVNPLTVYSSVAGPNAQSFSPVVLSSGTLLPTATQDVVITTTYDMTAVGTYTFSGNTSVGVDGNTTNDTMPPANRTVTGSVSLPQSVDFTGYTGANLTAVFPNWSEQVGVTPTGTASAWISQTGVGAVGNITARINLFTNTRNEWIMGPKVVPLVGTNLTFKAAVTNWNSIVDPDSMDNDDKVRVMVSTNCGGTWTSIYQMDSASSLTTTLTQQTVPLGAYAGTPIVLAFYATDGPINDPSDYDFHIDDIQIGDALADDIGATVVAEDAGPAPAESVGSIHLSRSGNPVTLSMKGKPEKIFADGGVVSFDVVAKNFGTSGQVSYQIGWAIDGASQTAVSNTESLDPSDEDTLTLTWAAPTAGDHTVRAWTILGSDGNPGNDSSNTVSFEVLGANVVFREVFNDTAGGVFPPAGWDTVNVDGGGTVAPWYQGYANVFAPKEGPGKAADNFNSANGFYIDDYLITPSVAGPAEGARYVAFRYLMYDGGPSGGSSDYMSVDDVRILAGSGPAEGTVDTLVFFANSNPSIWNDSLEIRVSLTGTNPGDFTTLLDYINIPKGVWTKFSYPLPAGGSIGTNVVTGWNIVSNPVTTASDSMKQLFPSSLFTYGFKFVTGSGYVQESELANGTGYWAKFPGATGVVFSGSPRTSDSINVVAGWNLVGSISSAVDTGDVTTNPSGILASNFFGYPYSPLPSAIAPGKGYWVKANAAGKIYLEEAPVPANKPHALNPLETLNSLTITDAQGGSQTLYFGTDRTGMVNAPMFVMPPAPPSDAFDARFESADGGHMVQLHEAEAGSGASFPVRIQSVAYPLTVRWKVSGGLYELVNSATGKTLTSMDGEGTMQIPAGSGSGIAVRLTGSEGIPAEFALMQNYPNPFNPSTMIKFGLPNESRVTVEIYNVLGERVRTLVSDVRKAGYHTIEWNGTDNREFVVGSGVYFVRVSATGVNGQSFVDVRKMTLMK
ncbi:MAG: FlgD immunoglobulin-like domain containing protein [Bacteroidota bacterium]